MFSETKEVVAKLFSETRDAMIKGQMRRYDRTDIREDGELYLCIP